ncbi:extensin [Pseudomonas sp. PIC25]|uniref:extensin-like domain-containing protein n=1 Tax=Pseudomonas sp. PIC25 TaxID=1958773 RepID=UPI000BAB486C|nr:extensin family protein [Pseudomonas sp. PIC25]PAU52797.1 extensin [Pseudomonas sp. PIC25]
MNAGRFLLLVVLLLGATAVAVWRGWIDLPPRWNPWAPLDVRESPNPLTSFKLWRLRDNRALCEQALATSGLRYAAVPDSLPAPDCPIENSVRIQRGAVAFNGGFIATCPLAVAYALFEHHGLQPAAQKVYGQPVVQIEHYGSFACRNIGQSNRRSQHARANALDIAGFRLRDGRRITVARDWKGNDRDARFLRLVRDAACRSFNTTLGPDYNRAHHDHFHLDMGLYRMCR